jgi:hypothetical protein
MTSITTWIRLEPRTRDADMTPGVEARLHDPLWLLARQWQLGELDGEDGGSAVLARARHDIGRITGFAPRGGATIDHDPATLPTAALAEATPRGAARPIPDLVTRVRTGRHLVRLLTRAGFVERAARLTADFPVAAAGPHLDAADRMLAGALAHRAPDGLAVATVLRAMLPALPPALAEPPADAGAVVAIATSWLSWLDATEVAPAQGAWRSDHLEHAFSLRADLAATTIALDVAEHHGGPLGWPDIDLGAGDPSARPPERGVATAVPGPVHYRGMPARRYWELEDGAVDWNAIDAGPGEVARMLLIDFALVFSDDWLQMPIDLDAGTLARVTSLVVTDSFGVRTLIEPASTIDPSWRMFGLGGSGPPVLLVQPHAPILRGRGGDEIVVAEDEEANLAWAIERAVARLDGQARPVEGPAPDATRGYRLAGDVPLGWHPLRPVMTDDVRQLARAAIPGQDRDALTGVVDGLRTLASEELAVGPIRLRTEHRLSRTASGRVVVWRAIVRDRVARASVASSGLAFDQVGDNP